MHSPFSRRPQSPQSLYNHCFQFLLGITIVAREIEDNCYAKFFLCVCGGGGGWNNDKSHLPVKVHSIEPAVLSYANDCGLRKMLLGNVVAKAVWDVTKHFTSFCPITKVPKTKPLKTLMFRILLTEWKVS